MHPARFDLRHWFITFSLLLITYCLLLILPKSVTAQTNNLPPGVTSTNTYNSSSIDQNVPRNQHNNVQITTIEVMATLICQLTGIDPINPNVPCLGVNPQTNKIGYAPTPSGPDGKPQVGGLIGTATGMIAYTFQPIATTGIYVNYLSENFGIVKSAYADHDPNDCEPDTQGYGFCGLMPIFHLWEAVRNISYALLVLALTFIGIGVMLRVKIDPRTVMTIQNQIPKVIVAIILITFSYAISAILVDLMWTTTYAGVNVIVNANPEVKNLDIDGTETFGEKASKQLLEIPIVYVHNIFNTKGDTGIVYLTKNVAGFIGDIISDVVRSMLGVDDDNRSCVSGFLPPKIDFGQCVGNAIGFMAKLAASLVIFFVLIIALFKIWFNLLKAFVFTLLYVIVSPVYIVFGLLPSKPLGFEAWLRRFFANIAVFPLTVFVLVGARVLMDIFDKNTQDQFIPPLIGHNAGANFGALLALGAILIAPSLQTILREKLGVKQIGTPGIVAAGMAAGAAVVGAPVGRAMKHLNRYDPRTGDTGALAKLKRRTGEKTLAGLTHLPGVGGSAEKALGQHRALDRYGSLHEQTERDAEGKVTGTFKPRDKGISDWKEERAKKKENRKTYGFRDARRIKKGKAPKNAPTPPEEPKKTT